MGEPADDTDARYREFIQTSPEAIWRFDLDKPMPIDLSPDEQIEFAYKHAYLGECNLAMARMYGFSDCSEIIGARLPDLLVRDDPKNIETLRAFVTGGYKLEEVESHERDKNGKDKYFLNSYIGVVEDGKLLRAWGSQQDITERKVAERTQKFLLEASKVLSSSLEYERTLENIAELAVRSIADWCSIFVVDKDDSLRRITTVHSKRGKEEIGKLLDMFPVDPDSKSGAPQVIRTGETAYIPIVTKEMIDAANLPAEHRKVIDNLGLHSAITVPLKTAARTYGALSFVSAESKREFTRQDVELAEELGRRAAIAIENARLYQAAEDEIRHRERIQQELVASSRRFRELFEQSLLSIQVLSPDGFTIQVNSAWERLWGISKEDFYQWNYNMLEDQQLVKKGVMPYIVKAFSGTATEIPPVLYDPAEIGRPGKKRWVRAYVYPVKDIHGKVEEVVLMHEDITERMEAEEAVKHHAHHDALTDLPNRKALEDALSVALLRSQQRGTTGAVMFIDLDRFKNINDSLGHTMGDLLLKEVAMRFKSCLRDTDMVARLGGDEFIILLSEINGVKDTTVIAEKIFKSLQTPIRVGELTLHVTTSIGIAVFPNDGIESQVVLKHADTALYQAKETGRNRYHLYNQTMEMQTAERFALENELRDAITRDEFMLYYQPIVDVKSNKLLAMEALVRWKHPRLGLVFPNEFIPIAEESGLIAEMSEWVLREACRQRKEWLDAGMKGFRVAVNMSARPFITTDRVGLIRSVLQELDLPAHLLEVEITESMALKDVEKTITILWQLRQMGVHITIDDFGMGYSSLSYLRRFPINTLKIDRSFVHHCATDEQDATIIRTIISMAHTLNLQFVAEGVETKQQVDFLATLHCHYLQGYFIRRPTPAADCSEWLAETKIAA